MRNNPIVQLPLPLALRLGEDLLQLQPLPRAHGRLHLLFGRIAVDDVPKGADDSRDLHLVRIMGTREADPSKAFRSIAASYLEDPVEKRDLGRRNAHAPAG